MKVRIVAATLTVALGFWSGAVAFAQDLEKDILEFAVPGQELDRSLESELPLQGALSDSPIPEAIANQTRAQGPPAGSYDEWLNSVRGRVSRLPRRRIALGLGAAGVFLMAGWAVVSVLRKRSRRAYRRSPRSAGGSRTHGLDEVVAAVQLGQSKHRRADRPFEEPVTGREWPR